MVNMQFHPISFLNSHAHLTNTPVVTCTLSHIVFTSLTMQQLRLAFSDFKIGRAADWRRKHHTT